MVLNATEPRWTQDGQEGKKDPRHQEEEVLTCCPTHPQAAISVVTQHYKNNYNNNHGPTVIPELLVSEHRDFRL